MAKTGFWLNGARGKVGHLLVPGANNTYLGIINALNLEIGDQLTFIAFEVINNAAGLAFKFARVILDPREADGSPAPLSTKFVENNAIVKPFLRNEGSFASLTFIEGDSADQNYIAFSLDEAAVAVAVIVSKEDTPAP